MFASAFDSIKNAFVTKPFTPNAYQANPSQIVDALEAAFKAKFDIAPDMDRLRTITPRQAYAGGENVFVYAAQRAQVHLGLAYDDLKTALEAAWGVSTIIVLSLPATISDEFSRIVMGFAVPLNYAYYSTKHLSFDVGSFAAKVTAQLHGTKLAMKKRNRVYSQFMNHHEPEVTFLHTKHVVMSSGTVLTAQLDSLGNVTFFYAAGNDHEVTVRWHDDLSMVKVTDGKWNEDEFNAVFVKMVSQKTPQYTEELAAAALGAKPLTKASTIQEFAEKTKTAKKEAKAEAKVDTKQAETQKEEAKAEAAPAEQPKAAAPAQAETAAAEAQKSAAHTEAEAIAERVTKDLPNVNASVETVDGITRVKFDLGEVAGVSAEVSAGARNNKPCGDQNAIRIVRKTVAKNAIHVQDVKATKSLPKDTIAFVESTNTIWVISNHIYQIVCIDGGSNKPVFRLVSNDLKALGDAIGYDFGQYTNEFCITNAALMHLLLGNGNTLMPVIFNK